MKKGLALVLSLLCVILLFTGCGGESKDVVIYSSMEDYRNANLSQKLKEKFPDFNVKVQQITTGNNAAKIKAEGANTEADIVLALETASYEQIAEYFAPLEGFQKNNYLPEMDNADKRCFTWEKFEGSFIVNTEVLKEKNLPEPKTYEDLLKPEYKGMIVMSNPKTSGTGYMFLNTWVNSMGEDEAFAYVEKLQANVKQFTESGSGPVKMLVQGEAAIGLGMVFQAAEQINQGAPLKVIQPEGGAPYNTTVFGIIKGKETKENVKKVFEYLNTEYFLFDKENYAPGKVIENQQIKIKNYPADLELADMSTITDMELKQKLLDRWNFS